MTAECRTRHDPNPFLGLYSGTMLGGLLAGALASGAMLLRGSEPIPFALVDFGQGRESNRPDFCIPGHLFQEGAPLSGPSQDLKVVGEVHPQCDVLRVFPQRLRPPGHSRFPISRAVRDPDASPHPGGIRFVEKGPRIQCIGSFLPCMADFRILGDVQPVRDESFGGIGRLSFQPRRTATASAKNGQEEN